MTRVLCFCFWVFAAFAQDPLRFYATAATSTDTFPFHVEFIIDVVPDGPDVVVRFIRIAPLTEACQRTVVVQMATTRLKNTSPRKLAGVRNPCDGGPAAIANAPQNPAKAELRFASASVWIVAQCGEHEAKLQLSDRSGADFDQLGMRTFGAARPFDRPSPEQNFSLQQAGAAIVPELLAGRFDAGFSDGTLGKVLADYHGPVLPPDFTAQLMNADTYQFANYVPPIYPAVAKLSQIHGRVMLEVGVDVASGEVRRVTAPSGDPLLIPAAIVAAQKWRFVPGTVPSQPIHAMLDFAWRCP